MKKIIFILTVVLLSSCELDVPPHSALSASSVTPKDVPALTNGVYRNCQNIKRESFILNDILGGLVQRYTHSSAKESIDYYLQIKNDDLAGIWSSYFKTLAKVNDLIIATENLPEDEDVLKAKGAAHFFRAYIYLQLVTHWGDVPILEKREEFPSKSPAGSVWAFIETDLNLAIGFLKSFSESGQGYYYVSKEAAMGLKARMLLYCNRKPESAALAESLIAQGQFTLDSFENIFSSESNAKNAETIFAFLNLTEESSTNLSSLFYNYSHPNSGSYFHRPTSAILTLFDNEDNRKAISWDNQYGGVNYFNKYPSGQTGTDPVIIVRIAEMYLISAEAKGLNGGGLARLNELRHKRGLGDVTPAPATEDDFIEAILKERDLELLTENHRYYDLVRTGKTDKIGLEDYQKLLPIPEEQRVLNPYLGQNTGY